MIIKVDTAIAQIAIISPVEKRGAFGIGASTRNII
jgi:hypothetical protein